MFVAGAMIGSALIGGISANNAAKKASAAQDRATEASLEAFRFSKPYIERSYNSAEDYLDNVQNTGAYGGQTLAAMNPYELAGNNYIGNMGMAGAGQAFGITNQGANFAKNYADLYGMSQQDRLADAQNYAMNNSQPLVDAAMRDDYRTLTEQTMPGINMAASASGNINSSRAGVADAVAQRGFNDRKADMTASIQDRLMDRRINQQEQQFQDAMKANYGLKGAYTDGINAMGSMGDFMTGAGQNLRNYNQLALDDAKAAFERDRDFALDQQIKYQGGILNNAVYDNKEVAPNYHNTGAATFGGAMQGAGLGLDLVKAYKDIKG
jgi:hypothetical protein